MVFLLITFTKRYFYYYLLSSRWYFYYLLIIENYLIIIITINGILRIQNLRDQYTLSPFVLLMKTKDLVLVLELNNIFTHTLFVYNVAYKSFQVVE